MTDYCETCDVTVEVRRVAMAWGYEWRCVVCDTVTREDEDDWDDNSEEE